MSTRRNRPARIGAPGPSPLSSKREQTPSTPQVRARRNLAFRVAALLLPVGLLVLGEIALHLVGWGYPVGFLLPTRESGQPAFRENRQFAWTFFPPTIARTPQPQWFTARKAPNTFRVLVFGESAAMGDPDANYGFARQLECILQARHPDRHIEVLNMGMTAIDSRVMLEIARGCRAVESDAWIFYAGNNEVIGPFGAGTLFGRRRVPPAAVDLLLAFRSTRLGQAAAQLLQMGQEPPQWDGMERFLNLQVPADDARLGLLRQNYAANLRRAVRIGQESGAKVLVATMPVNLGDCPPFASAHRPGLGAQELADWDRLVEQGSKAEAARDFTGAINAFERALALDSAHAELRFLHASCLRQAGKHAEAQREFESARDLDVLRFRADSGINAINRKVAAETRALLVDAEAELVRRRQGAPPGNDLFLDHVHLSLEGNYAVATQLAAALDGDSGSAGPGVAPVHLPLDAMAQRLAFTSFDRRRVAEVMAARFRQPPFTQQRGAEQRNQRWRAEMARALEAPGASRATYARACDLAPRDWRLHACQARFLNDIGDLAGAERSWKEVTRLLPHHADAWLSLANLAWRTSRPGEATALCQEALLKGADPSQAFNELGLIAQSRKDNQAAVAWFRKASRVRPGSGIVRRNLAEALLQHGDTAGAADEYREMIRRDPGDAVAHVDLGRLLGSLGRSSEARSLLEQALRLDPANAEAHRALAALLTQLNRHAEALAHYQAAVELRPDSAGGHIELGMALSKQGRELEALSQFEQGARLAPGLAAARFNYGIALAKARNFAGAVEQLEAALALDPNHPVAGKALEQARRELANRAAGP